MITVTLPEYLETFWVISPCDTVESVRVLKVTYVETGAERRVIVKTSAGEYRLHKLYDTREKAVIALKDKMERQKEG